MLTLIGIVFTFVRWLHRRRSVESRRSPEDVELHIMAIQVDNLGKNVDSSVSYSDKQC